ncbi:MAG TPA: hypothetical protein EYN67_03665 [Flavobacteriales bacterium]|nr:hypothetical protein [Flavobacteriales bacterium]
MSWSGTVTCSHCYTTGHNRRKCPDYTAMVLRRYKDNLGYAEDKDGDIDHYTRTAERYRLEYMKRTKIDPATGEKVKNKTAKAERMKKVTCGYCQETGHTRRICEVVKRDKLVFIEESRRVRVGVLADARETGIGVGSMIPIRTHGYNSSGEWGTHTSLRYVKSVDWYTVTSGSAGLWVHHIVASKLASANQSRWTSRDKIVKMQENFKEACNYAEGMSQSEPTASLIPSLDPPDGWLDCAPSTIDVASAFPTTGNRHNKQRGHSYAWPSGVTAEVIRDLGLEEHWEGRF